MPYIKILLFSFVFNFGKNSSFAAEKVFADQVTYTSPNGMSSQLGCGGLGLEACYYKVTVENPANAINPDAGFARLFASPGLLQNLNSYEGAIELSFPTMRPANSTVYIRINQTDGLLDLLLGGSLAQSLANLTSSLLLSRQIIEIQARNNGTVVYSSNSENQFSSTRTSVVVDSEGNHYLRMTPTADFNRVRVLNSSGGILGFGAEVNFDVYHAFYFSEPNCSLPEFTSFDGSDGLNLNLLPGNQNLQYAIDGNDSSYSEFSSGQIGVGLSSSLVQHIYFSGPSDNRSDLNLTFSFSNSLVNVGLLQNALENVSIEAFLGDDSVFSTTLDTHNLLNLLSLAELDLLNLFGEYNQIQFPVEIVGAFDRVAISYRSFVEINAVGGFRLHEVSASHTAPAHSENFRLYQEICAGDNVLFLTPNEPGLIYDWYEDIEGGTLIRSSNSGEWVEFENVEEDASYFVSARTAKCNQSSSRALVQIRAFDLPVLRDLRIKPEGESYIDDLGNYVFSEGEGIVTIIPSYVGAVPGTFAWFWDEDLLLPLAEEFTDSEGVTFRTYETGVLEIHDPVFRDEFDPYRFFLKYQTPQGCNISKEVTFQSLSIILPISPIENFNTELLTSRDVKLSWNSGAVNGIFYLERSGKDLSFSVISEIEVNSKTSKFSFIDHSFYNGDNYYRIRYRFPDGREFYTSLQRVFVETKDVGKIHVFPNPFQEKITILKGINEDQKVSFLITDLSGKILVAGEMDGQVMSVENLSGLPKGTYILRVHSISGTEIKKLIKK